MKQIMKILAYLILFFSNPIFADCSINPCPKPCKVQCVSRSCQTPKIGIPADRCQVFKPNPSCPLRCSTACYDCGTSIFLPRSQGANTAREMMEWNPFMYKYNVDQDYTHLQLAVEYTRSFRPCRIAQSLFCTDCLTFSGSQVPDRQNGTDVIADYFGLAPDFRGTLKIRPRIENYILDFEIFAGFDEWCPGAFLRLHIPVTHTRWNLGLDECFPCDNLTTVTAQRFSQGQIPQCYMSTSTTAVTPAFDLHEALSGRFLFGDMKTPWRFGKFDFSPRNKTLMADVDIMIGQSFWCSPSFVNAFYLKAVVPTGNRPKSKFVFEPIVGNGKFWELGGGISGHWIWLGNPCASYYTVGFYWEGNVTHLFSTHQKRSFDFINNGLLSRYLLLKEFEKDGITYAGNMINAINFATRNCNVRINAQGEFSIALCVRNDSWVGNIGYNIWGKTKETVCIATHCPCELDRRKFGIKGTEGVCALEYTINSGTFGSFVESLPINSTQSNTTMFTPGTVDNPQLVQPTVPGDIVVTALSRQVIGSPIFGNDVILAQNSERPVILTCEDLDPNSAALCSALTHKFFAHFSYIWFDTCWEPNIGIGAEIEIDGKAPHRQSLNQWGIWVKGGISF